MANILKTDEIIDLEVFIADDEKESAEYKKSRDFSFYSKAPDYAKANHTALLRYWIAQMRGNAFSVGMLSNWLLRIFSAVLLLVGILFGYGMAGRFFGIDSNSVSVNIIIFAFSCVIVPLVLFFSAIFVAPKIGVCLDKLAALLVSKILKKGAVYAAFCQNRKWIFLKGALCAQYFGLGIVCGIFFTQLSNQMSKKYEYNLETTLPSFVSDNAVYNSAKIAALPWAAFWGEGIGYPSARQVALCRKDAKNTSSQTAAPQPEAVAGNSENAPLSNADISEIWARFFLLCALFYGIFLRVLVFVVTKFRISRCFGKHRLLNDRKINEILSRMEVSSSSADDWQSLKSDADCDNMLMLRGDMLQIAAAIKNEIAAKAQVSSCNVFKYDFLSDVFGDENFEKEQLKYKTINLACFSDDYNEEVFENIENIVNAYPNKFVNIILLGRYNSNESSFAEPLAVEKSWWQRKINSVCTRNLKLF